MSRASTCLVYAIKAVGGSLVYAIKAVGDSLDRLPYLPIADHKPAPYGCTWADYGGFLHFCVFPP
ncbi:hypothetical protein [uncultured Murdochiella sp.]|uniref:hypothetical protein n=1 Tax=uncultured Murdochiella sp. TaxID=1586095 RepID=UPI0028055B19|nr:hypothetical protein [uncultured Murdochiella sp.]